MRISRTFAPENEYVMPFGIATDLTMESPTRIYSGGGKRRLLALAELAAVALQRVTGGDGGSR